MAITREQSQFRRLLSSGIFVPLSVVFFALAAITQAAQAAQTKELVAPASHYLPTQGENFFLLSETSYGSDEIASVRLETQRYSPQLEEYGGIDIAVYKIPDPIAFLRAQDNLHRIKLAAKPQAEGMANMLSLSWDKIWANTRFAWRHLFSTQARQAATAAVPQLKTSNGIFKPTALRHPSAYAPLPGLKSVERFRYPVQSAKPIQPPEGVKLAGSSSEFLPSFEGNIRIPIGKREPGLYLVEAFVGKFRAVTLVFVSDSVAVTKNSSDEILVWTAGRKDGAPVGGSQLVWSDGVGVLKSGSTNAEGVARLAAKSPESSYIFGLDPAGGVFISENFYHDSEIYNAKIYAVTDRPLYRPGDLVQVKFLGREFKSARSSAPVPSGEIKLKLVDPAGTDILTRTLRYEANKGGETSFRLPEVAQAGGWELVFSKGNDLYGAAFRVADYVKPHFEIDVVLSKKEFKTKEEVGGKLRLTYPDGKPVADALVRLTARAQPLTMVEGELRYGGQFPLAIKADELKTGSDGAVTFSLPPSDVPARYLVSLLAQDGAAYRVRANKEILIERGATLWKLSAPAYFSRPGETVDFSFLPQGGGTTAATNRPAHWEILRLEDRASSKGLLANVATANTAANTVRLDFQKAGSYTVSLKDANGNLVAATSHWVSGEGLKAIPGSVEIVFDKEAYRAGDKAEALITFPHPVSNALLTLERDKVETHALLAGKADWVNISQITPSQWKAEIPVKSDYGPNITFSVLYLNNGDYVFQNKGLRVAVPTVDVDIRPLRERYAPGETVTIELDTRIGGKATPALITLSVVDEMIYVLQPEIAPTISNFFYHPRRNNVRTAVSLSFIGYDLARMPNKGAAPVRRSPSERGIKILERPRRDDTDTAGWWPSLTTGADGKVSVTFKMPDALTRWRITVRAVTATGVVGQQTRHVESHKDFYAKWTGPTTFRQGDKPSASLVAFNQTASDAKVQLSSEGAGMTNHQEITLRPGANTILLPFDTPESGEIAIRLTQADKLIDSLRQPITVLPPRWLSERSQMIELKELSTPLTLPDDARDIKVSLARGSAGEFLRIADDLLEFPWGCAEQVASRLLPLSLIYPNLPADAPRLREMSQALSTQRLRLVQMAGPEASFGWWGPMTANSAWLTAYAYYADWHASKALRLTLPAEHWRQAMNAYSKYAKDEPLALRTLAVWFMAEMELPVGNLAEGLLQEAAKLSSDPGSPKSGSLWLGERSTSTDALTLVLMADLAQRNKLTPTAELTQRINAAREALRAQPEALGQALLAMESTQAKASKMSQEALKSEAARWLATIGANAPTLDRALALVWWNKALGGNRSSEAASGNIPSKLAGDWQANTTPFGAPTWRWNGKGKPSNLTLLAATPTALTAVVRYRSADAEKSQLPVKIERTLYRLTPIVADKAPANSAPNSGGNRVAALAGQAVEFKREVVSDQDIHSNELYLEEISLSSTNGNTPVPRFGLLEVPLPPGADVESGTWGIRLRGAESKPGNANPAAESIAMEKARHQPGELSYAIPIENLSEGRAFRHLLRFGSRGSFVLPPARFHRMYQPEEKAFEAVSERHLKIK